MSLLTAPMVGCGGDDSTSPSNDGGAGGEAGAAGAGGAVAPPAECGNGVRETGEACDDGDTTNEGACLADCSGSTSCGDGKVQSSEDCDDGNDINTDECTNKCVAAANGDGIIQPSLNEQCDDGNRVNTDDCTNDGQIAICGDGIVQVGVEACDAGKATEKCTADCALPTCGDGIVQTGEDCDDQNKSNTDSCLNTCLDASCGDGFIQAGVETCDSGNANSDTAECLTSCERASCGDGHVQAGVEACDESGATAACTVDCKPTSCGDGIQQDNEECDEGDANADNASASCTTSCTLPICGDGIQQGAEACDDGNGVTTDGCIECVVATCGDGIIWTNNETCDDGKANGTSDSECSATCGPVSCGDGVVQAGEQCDEGTSNSNTGACRTNCVAAACGDGAIQAGVEQCDDGALNGDTGACLSDCVAAICGDGKVQSGVEACDGGGEATADCTAECTSTDCGDGVIQTGEQCDNGADNANTADATCTTACLEPACGDKIVQTGEDCDDGNLTDNDSCSNACKAPICGDKIVQAGEGCDDGNTVETDGCSNTCQLTTCGNGTLEAGEQCDDGNTNNVDTCTNGCRLAVCGDGIVQSGLDLDGDGKYTTKALVAVTSLSEATLKKDLNGDGDIVDTITTNSGGTYVESLTGTKTAWVDLLESQLGESCDSKATGTTVVSGCTPACQLNTCTDGYLQAATTDIDQDGVKDASSVSQYSEAAEACDDGNDVANDGCTNTCTTSTCGDGVRQTGEACDLGTCNDVNGDGIISVAGDTVAAKDATAANPEQNPGLDCNMNEGSTACTTLCALPSCMDGFLQTDVGSSRNLVNADEVCDDGNATDTDKCTNTCKVAACGDGIVWTGVEMCDDKDAAGGCQNTTDPNPCAPATCGDNTPQAGEQCDSVAARDAGTCTDACQTNVCGDGFLGAGEECDLILARAGKAQDDIAAIADVHPSVDLGDDIGCTATCKVNVCGDGVVGYGWNAQTDAWSQEACDDGNTNDADGCHNDCTRSACGDGVLDAGEECDDDNLIDGDGCTAACTIAVCGDGVIGTYTDEAGKLITEGCDDGNTDPANLSTGDICSATCMPSTCGNPGGNVQGADPLVDSGFWYYNSKANGGLTQCGISATDNATGINTLCAVGSNGCTACDVNDDDDDTMPGIQVQTAGTLVAPVYTTFYEVIEGCDDGNAVNTDACRNDCQISACGDGIIRTVAADLNGDNDTKDAGEAIEVCDDGNDSTADNCVNIEGTCTVAACGDGYINLRQVAADISKDGDTKDAGEAVGAAEECDLGAENNIGGWCTNLCAKQCSTAVSDFYTEADPADADAALSARWNDPTARSTCYVALGQGELGDFTVSDDAAASCPDGSHLVSIGDLAEFGLVQTIAGVDVVNSSYVWMTCPVNNGDYAVWDSANGEPLPTGTPDAYTGDYIWGNGVCYTFKSATGWKWYSAPNTSTVNATLMCEVDTWAVPVVN